MADGGIKLKAELNKDFLNIFLEEENKVIGKIKTSNDRTLSAKLLPLLDNFFKKNKVSAKSIKRTEVKSELPDTFTSFRIVKVIFDTICRQNHPVKLPTAITGQARNTKKTKG